MNTTEPTADLTLTAARVQHIYAASNLATRTLAKKLCCTNGQLSAALEHGTNGDLALKLVELEDTLTAAPAGEESLPTTRVRKGPKASPRTTAAQAAAAAPPAPPAPVAPAPAAVAAPAEVIPPAPPAEGSRAWYAELIRESGTFNERAAGLVKGTDWVEAFVPLPMGLHERCKVAAKAMGVSLKQFRTYAFLRLVSEIENAEG